jgi:hypothetical protein
MTMKESEDAVYKLLEPYLASEHSVEYSEAEMEKLCEFTLPAVLAEVENMRINYVHVNRELETLIEHIADRYHSDQAMLRRVDRIE